MAIRKLVLFIFCWIFGAVFFSTQANAIFINEAKTLDFAGKLQSRLSVRTTDSTGFTQLGTDSGDVVQHRNLLYLQVDHDLKGFRPLGLKLKYHLLGRFLFEGIYDYGPSQFQDLKDFNKDDIEDVAEDIELWEAYLDISRGPLFVRIGRQNLAWGETDVFRLMDLINPLDDTFGGIFEDLDDRRVPLKMIRGSYNFGTVGPIDAFALEGFWVPGQLEDEIAPQAPFGTPYSPPVLPVAWGSIPGVVDFNEAHRYLDDDNGSSRYGFRCQGVVGQNLTLSLGHFKSYLDLPAVVFDMTQQFIPLPPPAAPIPAQVMLWKTFPEVRVTGLSMNYYEMNTDMVIRAEVAYFDDEPVFIPEVNTPGPMLIPTGAPPPAPPVFPQFRSGEIPTKDFVKFSIGLDKDQWIRWLNKKKTFLISFQYFGTYCRDYDNRMRYAVPDTPDPSTFNIRHKRFEQTFTLLTNTLYLQGNIMPELIAAYDPRGALMFMPSISYRHEPFMLKLQYANISGSFVGFGFFKDRDQLSLTATWYW
ncbi:MAG: hypothetical protein JRH15_07605 [Deltaproteobacteria bacterium]|nr:hypothetical protein [Deltaproteobacteria bacterium]